MIMEAQNLSGREFSSRLGISSAGFFNIIRGRRSKPSFALIVKILHEFPDLNPDWLLLGEGSMWRSKSGILSHAGRSTDDSEQRLSFLIDDIRLEQFENHKVYELAELAEKLNKKYKARLRELIKINEQQDEIIQTLKKMKNQLL